MTPSYPIMKPLFPQVYSAMSHFVWGVAVASQTSNRFSLRPFWPSVKRAGDVCQLGGQRPKAMYLNGKWLFFPQACIGWEERAAS